MTRMAKGISADPTGSSSTTRVAVAPLPSVRWNRTPSGRGPDRQGHVGLDDGVVAEGVVVEHQAVVLDEDAEAGVAVAEGVQHAALAGGPLDDGVERPGAATEPG